MERRSLFKAIAVSGMALAVGMGALAPAHAQDSKK